MSTPFVLFSVLDAIGTVHVSSDSDKLIKLTVSKAFQSVAVQLTTASIDFGILNDVEGVTTDDVLRELGKRIGIDEKQKDRTFVFAGSASKEPEAFFASVARQVSRTVKPSSLVFVSENSWQRKAAMAVGWRVCPHVQLLPSVLKGQVLRYMALSLPRGGKRKQAIEKFPVVALGTLPPENTQTIVVAPQTLLGEMVEAGYQVRLLGGAVLPLVSTLYLLRDDRFLAGGKSQLKQHFDDQETASWLLEVNQGWLLVAVPAGRSIEEVHFEETIHGHVVKLSAICSPGAARTRFLGMQGKVQTLWTSAQAYLSALQGGASIALNIQTELSNLTSAELLQWVERLSGVQSPTPTETSIVSRHPAHLGDGNRRAVNFVCNELTAILTGVTGGVHKQYITSNGFHNVVAEITGTQQEKILLGAHLDSTSNIPTTGSHSHYTYPAPGADDNATGCAALVLIAKFLSALAKTSQPKRTIRLVLFNFEELGFEGSLHSRLASVHAGENILAMMNLDMIGYHADAHARFEIHCGAPSNPSGLFAEIEASSLQLGTFLGDLVPHVTLSGSLSPQLFPSPGNPDDGVHRSDHTPFQVCGFPAAWITEDFFDSHSATRERNPHYHDALDTADQINATFASDITRVVALATWILATV